MLFLLVFKVKILTLFLVLTTVTPSSGSTAGGTVVKIGGSFLLDGAVIDSSVVNCVVDSKTASSTSVTFSEVTCATPSRTQSTRQYVVGRQLS